MPGLNPETLSRHEEFSGDVASEFSGPLEVPFVRVRSIQAAGKPERAPGVKAPAGELPDHPVALLGQHVLHGPMPELREKRQPGRRKYHYPELLEVLLR